MGPAWGRSRLGPHDFFSYPSRSIPLREQTCTWGVVPAISQTGLQSKGPYNWAELTSPPRFPHAPPAPARTWGRGSGRSFTNTRPHVTSFMGIVVPHAARDAREAIPAPGAGRGGRAGASGDPA